VTAMVLLAAACWAMRALFVLVVPADRLPARLQHGLAQLAPAVLAALVVAELAGSAQGAPPTTALVLVGSMVLAALVVRRTGSLGLAILIGLAGALVVDVVL
jgi:branched-subunit amino acid transport protein